MTFFNISFLPLIFEPKPQNVEAVHPQVVAALPHVEAVPPYPLSNFSI